MADNTDAKKNYIDTFIEKLYMNDKINYLFPETLAELQSKAEQKYLSSDYSYDDISDDIFKVVEERKIEYARKNREANICNLTEKYYNKHKNLFPGSLDEAKKDDISRYLDSKLTIEEIDQDMYDRIKKRLEEIKDDNIQDEKLEGDPHKEDIVKEDNKEEEDTEEVKEEKKEEDKENSNEPNHILLGIHGGIGGVAATGVIGATSLNTANNTNASPRVPFSGVSGIHDSSSGFKDRAEVIALPTESHTEYASSNTSLTDRVRANAQGVLGISNETKVTTPEIRNDAESELSAMMDDTTSKSDSLVVVKNRRPPEEPPKQFVKLPPKKPDGGNGSAGAAKVLVEAGSISISTIILSILAITSFILIAMILNVLLK